MTPIERRGYVYPGHPLTLATIILIKYSGSLDVAFAASEHGYPNALADIDIPGAGDAVYSALSLLRKVQDGVLTAHEAVEEADRVWVHVRTNCGYADQLEPGQREAAAMVPTFVQLATAIRRVAANEAERGA